MHTARQAAPCSSLNTPQRCHRPSSPHSSQPSCSATPHTHPPSCCSGARWSALRASTIGAATSSSLKCCAPRGCACRRCSHSTLAVSAARAGGSWPAACGGSRPRHPCCGHARSMPAAPHASCHADAPTRKAPLPMCTAGSPHTHHRSPTAVNLCPWRAPCSSRGVQVAMWVTVCRCRCLPGFWQQGSQTRISSSQTR